MFGKANGIRVVIGAILLLAGTAEARGTANQVRLDVSLSTPTVLAGRTQRTYLKVALTGFPLEATSKRAPVNVALVLDRSGSMTGEKILKAKEAAIQAIQRLGADDIVSVVAYNHTVSVLLPATRVGTDRGELIARVERLFAAGSTALFAGVSRGAAEVRKFLDRNRVNRVILVSDGLANVGPSSPGELGELGRSLIKEGISVTTVGLGLDYNEDLMVELARASDGNHAYAENATDLARIFQSELGDVLSVVAREVRVEVRFGPGMRPVRVLGRGGEVDGRSVIATFNQLYANQEKYLLVEVEVPASAAGRSAEVAVASVRYLNAVSRAQDEVGGRAIVEFTDRPERVDALRNLSVEAASVEMIANDTNRAALRLRDEGKVEEAKRVLRDNAVFLGTKARVLPAPKLKALEQGNLDDLQNMDGEAYKSQRKVMRKRQYEVDFQQAW